MDIRRSIHFLAHGVHVVFLCNRCRTQPHCSGKAFDCFVGVDCNIAIIGFMLSPLDRIKLAGFRVLHVQIFSILLAWIEHSELKLISSQKKSKHRLFQLSKVKEGFPCNGNPAAGVPAQESCKMFQRFKCHNQALHNGISCERSTTVRWFKYVELV